MKKGKTNEKLKNLQALPSSLLLDGACGGGEHSGKEPIEQLV